MSQLSLKEVRVKRITSFLFSGRRKVFTGLAVALIVPAVAWAAWTLSGQGEFRAKTGELQAVTFGMDATPATTLLPGIPGAASLTYNNPNSYAVTITGAAAGATKGFLGAPATCPATNITVNPTAANGTSVPAGTGTLTVPGLLTLAATAPNGCMNQTAYADVTFSYGVGN